MNTKSPSISVVMAVYNGAATLPKALASIAGQTWQDFEVVVVDDASTDATPLILQEWRQRFTGHRYVIITNPVNCGLAQSLNRSIAKARGTWVARLDADDRWLPEKNEKQVKFLSANPGYGIIGSFYINEQGQRRRAIRL